MGDLTGIEPPRMDWAAPDLPTAFQAFKQYCTLIFDGPLKEKTEEERVTYLLIWVGQEGLKMFNSWDVTGDDLKDPTKIWEHFEKHLEPKTNFRLNRFHLQKFRQNTTESIDEYMTRCKLQAHKCKFRDTRETEERLIEQLIIGTRHKKVQEILLGKDDKLTLDSAMNIARTREATLTHMEQLGADCRENTVHSIKHAAYGRNKHSGTCRYCGGNHPFKPKEKCPAYGTTCDSCNKPNHWKNMCLSKSHGDGNSDRRPRSRSRHRGQHKQRSRSRRKQVNEVTDRSRDQQQERSLEDSFDTLNFSSIDAKLSTQSTLKDTRDEVFALVDITLENKPRTPANLKVKIDTGAQGNVLPVRIYRRMFPEKLDSSGFPKPGATKTRNTVLTVYNGMKIHQYGSIIIPCKYQGKYSQAEFYVVDADGPAIMGLPTSRELRLVILNCAMNSSLDMSVNTDTAQDPPTPINSKDDLVQLYPDRFKGIGNFKGTFHITVDPDVPPVVHAPRRCPIHLRDELKHELDAMEKIGVITKITEPTSWVSSLAYSRKANGKLRVCLDPKDLNLAIKRPHYKTPTLEEITHNFAGATIFSKLDARHGYWSVSLDEESSRLTTCNSPFGRYRFLRLPFGLNMSQDVFQERMDQILELCPGTTGIADDVAVFGKTKSEHEERLHNLMKVAREHGLVFNIDKCEINKPSMKFFGLVFDADGVHPDPDKVKDIKEWETPSDAKKLQEFLGIVTYMAPFIPHLSQLTAPLRELMKSDTEFQWSKSHQTAFEKIVSLICREVTLSYFDPKQSSVLQVDGSSRGLGAVLLQNDQPIAFASKSLTDTEQRYANIEREMLAVVFGCEKFHTYLYGKHFTVESDHKPLEMIHLKNLAAAPQRLQRMLLRIQPYDLTIKYRPGKEVLIADALSRSPGSDNVAIDFDVNVHLVQFSTQKLEALRDNTRDDPELRELKDIIIKGWPDKQRSLPLPLRPYWSYRDELTVEDGIIMKGDRVIIPKVMREDILSKLHESHQGIEKTRLRARTCVYWNNINSDIEKLVRGCGICQHAQVKQRPEPLHQHELPTRPWQILGTDLFYLDGDEYLIVSDYYSKYPLVRNIQGRATSQTIIDITKSICAEQGVPEII